MNKTERACGLDAVVVVMERGYTNVAMDAARKAGARGGTVIAKGTPEQIVKVKESYTGQYVKKYLER